jgi:hypothetical protein
VGHREGWDLLTPSITNNNNNKKKKKKKKRNRDKVEAKVGNSLYKLTFAFPFVIYF